jgi:hypothetical protein
LVNDGVDVDLIFFVSVLVIALLICFFFIFNCLPLSSWNSTYSSTSDLSLDKSLQLRGREEVRIGAEGGAWTNKCHQP